MAKIDLVYLWVDNSDPDWQKKQQKYMPNYNTNKDAISACRFINNDELKKYSQEMQNILSKFD